MLQIVQDVIQTNYYNINSSNMPDYLNYHNTISQ